MTAQTIPTQRAETACPAPFMGSVVGVADAPDLLSLATSFTIEAEAWCLGVKAFEARIDAAIDRIDQVFEEVGR